MSMNILWTLCCLLNLLRWPLLRPNDLNMDGLSLYWLLNISFWENGLHRLILPLLISWWLLTFLLLFRRPFLFPLLSLFFWLEKDSTARAIWLLKLFDLGLAPCHQTLFMKMVSALRSFSHPIVLISFICILELINAYSTSVWNFFVFFDYLTIFFDDELWFNPPNNSFLCFFDVLRGVFHLV